VTIAAVRCRPSSDDAAPGRRRRGNRKYPSHKENRMPASIGTIDILADANSEKREEIIDLLCQAYWMELETVMSYIANSINPDGVRAQEVVASLAADVAEELAHAQLFAKRIKELYGTVPGSKQFSASQDSLQPPDDHLDIAHVIRGVIEAERGAIEFYNRVIEATDGVDPVTQDMVITILADEQNHMRTFEGFLREFDRG
jgi:bacterioferritin